MAVYFNLNNDKISKELLVNRISMILDNQGRLGLNDEKIPSPHNEPQRSRGFVLWKKVFLKISQISQENTCVGVSFRPATLFKKRLQHWCFPVKFPKFLKTTILKNTAKDWFCLIHLKILYQVVVASLD